MENESLEAKKKILLKASDLAMELAYSLKDVNEASEVGDHQNELNAGLHMISVYEKLMVAIESNMHEGYRKNITQFRKEKLNETQ